MSGAGVAQERSFTTGENSGKEEAMERQARMANRIHAPLHGVKPASTNPLVNAVVPEPKREELPSRDNPMLPCREN